jgi:hypothetical protein
MHFVPAFLHFVPSTLKCTTYTSNITYIKGTCTTTYYQYYILQLPNPINTHLRRHTVTCLTRALHSHTSAWHTPFSSWGTDYLHVSSFRVTVSLPSIFLTHPSSNSKTDIASSPGKYRTPPFCNYKLTRFIRNAWPVQKEANLMQYTASSLQMVFWKHD